MATSMSLVKYERQPRFIFSCAAAADISRFDPYAVLALPRENSRLLLELLHESSSAFDDAVATTGAIDVRVLLAARAAGVREAYRDLASRFHPDATKERAAVRPLCSWVSFEDHFNAIAAAHALLSDAHAACAYLMAVETADQTATNGDIVAAKVRSRHTCATARECSPRHTHDAYHT